MNRTRMLNFDSRSARINGLGEIQIRVSAILRDPIFNRYIAVGR